MNLHLKDKVALVTGSTAGIGFAIAAGLAAEGARVIVNGRSEKRVENAASAIVERHPEAKLELHVVILRQPKRPSKPSPATLRWTFSSTTSASMGPSRSKISLTKIG
jgi:NAD(P)-dependent dehydrogenase (short-subunit alcohol dehydrogenase family)